LANEKNALIVDDNTTNIFSLSAVLVKNGWTCTSALNGKQCLDKLAKTRDITMIFLDLMMPIMSGLEVIRIVRGNPNYKHIKIVVVSAIDDKEMISNCLSIGADSYLIKPVDFDKLQNILI
jgi:adenylate cyclase